MLRIRFHGRGGQGMKMACRMVSSAALWEGHYVQDCPFLGVERRGAPLLALTRIASRPILERSLITRPDLVIVADEALLNDSYAYPLQGLSTAGTVLINSECPAQSLRQRYGVDSALAVLNGSVMAMTHVGSLAGLSVALGAATCRLAGLASDSMEHAIWAVLTALGLERRSVERNLVLARLSYDELAVLPAYELQSTTGT
jgi:pyruvate ferredoxin oxidoreductase gamma subunit